jgi:hypothetical protein
MSSQQRLRSPFEALWRTLFLDTFDYKAPASETVAFLFPAFVAYLVGIIFQVQQKDIAEQGIENSNHLSKAQESLFEELEKLQSVVDQLKRNEPQADPSLPRVHRLRQWVASYANQGGQRATLVQDIVDGVLRAGVEEIFHFYREHKSAYLAMDLSRQDKTHLQQDEVRVQEIIQQHIFPNASILKRKMFRTGGNTLGTGHWSIVQGDEIWFLHGATAPAILRPLASGNYQFVGEAYVHGVVYGEVGAECRTHESITVKI